jgi:hypothetical protein
MESPTLQPRVQKRGLSRRGGGLNVLREPTLAGKAKTPALAIIGLELLQGYWN